jgi:hypothetical protein
MMIAPERTLEASSGFFTLNGKSEAHALHFNSQPPESLIPPGQRPTFRLIFALQLGHFAISSLCTMFIKISRFFTLSFAG